MVKERSGSREIRQEMGDTSKKKRIGLFGGTFDPVHKGHMAIARQAAEEARLDQVLFIPAADPPHKKTPGASYWHRVAMLEIMLKTALGEAPVEQQDCFAISLLEAELPFPSYTVDTLSELKKRFAGPIFYFIIGADSLLDLHCWYQYQKLLSLTHFIVLSRPGISLAAMQNAVQRLPGSFVPDTSPDQQKRWRSSNGAEILLLVNRLQKDISSTMIRVELRQGRAPQDVDSWVQEYITREELYGRRLT
ncbi:nicotinate-nucleotide adenylyltransferase [Candidatus Electrothrix aarhusensis]|uniref:Probable nicotinate-nucleotide adenylyltransferase n=1 Tax=Candidatus Electrothrix aarhusensis TaxID=1859131 RepID=A0A444IVF3_9BACT|nr:nicotinate-nucleotide adenylyltransferase [Candidatus Electrothrix aarhusensis]